MFRKQKGQIAVTDLFLALIIFLLLLITIISFWNVNISRYALDISYRELELTAFNANNLLLKQQGDPSGWENLDLADPLEVALIQSLGIAYHDKNLSTEKVDAFFLDLDKDDIELLLNIERYNFYVELTDLQGNDIIGAQGDEPNDPDEMITLRNIVYFQQQPSLFFFTLWSGETS